MATEKSVYQFKLPDVGEGIHEAEILQWLVNEGDRVALNQPLLEIQTDKAVVEIPAPLAGKVVQIRSIPGTLCGKVPGSIISGTVLQHIGWWGWMMR